MKSTKAFYQQLMEQYEQRSGFALEPSCDLAVRLYAAAAELQALSIQADWVLDQSFPQTATGIYLDRHAALRGLTRIPAARSEGVLRFSVSVAPTMALTVTKGTVCMAANGTRFETTETVILPAGSTGVDAAAAAVETGTSGNVPAGTVTLLTAYPVGITSCTNPVPFTGGIDPEEDDSLRQRILDSYLRLPNGANAAFYEEAAMTHAGVVAAVAVGRPRGIGTVDVFIASAAGMPSNELMTEVRTDLQKRREISVDVQVKAPNKIIVNVTVEVSARPDAVFADVQKDVETAIRSWFSGQRLGKSVLCAELGDLVYHVPGVQNHRIVSPTADVTITASELPTLGTLQVTKMEV